MPKLYEYVQAGMLVAGEHWTGTWKQYASSLLLLAPVLILGWCLAPSSGFPTHELLVIEEGATLAETASMLEAHKVVRSAILLEAITRITGNGDSVRAGTYYFETPRNTFEISSRISNGIYGIEGERITFIEGMTVREMADTLERELPSFDRDAFIELAKDKEGYLFPDTYFILPGTPPEKIVSLLEETFTARTSTLFETHKTTLTKHEVLTLASLLEKEARGLSDKRRVAGIIMNRLSIDMRLQVDAVFGYINGKSGYTPTGNDLESPSPYNTYKVTGLPPGPIANPSLESIEAALTPEETPYLYYLTGRDGAMYYGVTFEDHKENRRLYLD